MKQYVATIHFNCDIEPKEDADWLMALWFGRPNAITDIHIEEVENEPIESN